GAGEGGGQAGGARGGKDGPEGARRGPPAAGSRRRRRRGGLPFELLLCAHAIDRFAVLPHLRRRGEPLLELGVGERRHARRRRNEPGGERLRTDPPGREE